MVLGLGDFGLSVAEKHIFVILLSSSVGVCHRACLFTGLSFKASLSCDTERGNRKGKSGKHSRTLWKAIKNKLSSTP